MLNTVLGMQLDAISITVMIVLGVMSSLSWAVIITHIFSRLNWTNQAQLLRLELTKLDPAHWSDYMDEAYEASLKGVSLLATVASTAPYVGLFGTVWGIYHALMSVSVKESAALDAIAGPVGEALVMTAIGLGVALPAVWAYNLISRSLTRRFGALERSARRSSELKSPKPMASSANAALVTSIQAGKVQVS
jgi:biopolymer transport protein ExbB/TolQ